jgi:hypothetical protein
MKKALRVLHESFYSRALYHDAAHAWTGTGIGVLACAVLLMGLISVAGLVPHLGEYSRFKHHVLEQVPQATIQEGTLSIDEASPYVITAPDNTPLLMIDTRDEIAALSIEDTLRLMKEKEVDAFAGKHNAIVIKRGEEYRVYDYDRTDGANEPLTFDKTQATQWASFAEMLGVPLLALLMYGIVVVYAIIQMLLYSLAALGINSALKTRLNYSAMQRITVCALIPASLLGTVLAVVGVDLPFILCFILTLGYLVFGFKSTQTNGGL